MSLKELHVLAEMASLGKHLQQATFLFSLMHTKHVTQSWFSLVTYKPAYIILHELLILLHGNFFQ